MPPGIPFMKSELDESINAYDYADSSNREPNVPMHDTNTYFSRCRWFGEEFFKFSLRMAIFKNASESATVDDLKLEQRDAEVAFNYPRCTENLDAMKATKIPESVTGGNPQSYKAFVTKLGAVADGVDYGTRNKLWFMIQNLAGLAPAGMTADNALPSSSPPPGGESLAEDNRIALYTSKLYEWTELKNKSLSWKGKQVNIDPPSSEVTVMVDGEEFTAAARKQKMAKHIACKEACERFGI